MRGGVCWSGTGKTQTVTTGSSRPIPDVRATFLLRGSFAHPLRFIPPATTVQATVYSHFILQPQANRDQ